MDNDKFQVLMLEHVAKITQELTGIRQDVSEIKRDVSGLKQGQVRLEIIIENKIQPQIALLCEGQKQHTEQLNRIEAKLGEHDEFILKRIK